MHHNLPIFPRLPRAFSVLATLLGLAFLFSFSLAQAQASLLHCRTDPIVTLSNGDVVIITVDIDADPTQVQRIDYTLHVPAGVTATNIVYTGSDRGLNENLTLLQDSDAEYKSVTVVRTSKSVAVAVIMSLGGDTDSATGNGGKKLTAVISIDE